MRLTAHPDAPITVYYCKAGIQTGTTVRVRQVLKLHPSFKGMKPTTLQYACRGVSMFADKLGFAAEMVHDNSTGKPKASGARCVLQISTGIVDLIGAGAC
jgi:hypothetical protein